MTTFTMTAATVGALAATALGLAGAAAAAPSEAHRPLTPSVACKPRATTWYSTGR
jgi:hypothetical protein